MSLLKVDSMRTKQFVTGMSAAVCLSGLAVSAVRAQSIINIGVPLGASASGASAVNGNGSAVSANVDFQSAHRWTGSGIAGIGSLPGAVAASAEDISFDGAAIVGSMFFAVPDETARAYRWTAAGGLQDLGVLPGGAASLGNGISGDGSIVTGTAFDPDFNAVAFRWTSAGGMQSLGPIPGGINSEGRRVSHDGSTIIGVGDTPEGSRAFAWTSTGGMQNLGLHLPGDEWSSAFGVNADGSVIAGFSGSNAVIWTNGVSQSLGMLPGDTAAIAYTLSGDGSLVGGYSFRGVTPRATLWSQSLGLVDLNAYLPTLGIDLTGWELGYTRDISIDGMTIVGEGRFNGEIRGWVVTIPTPGAAGLLAVAGLTMFRRRAGRPPCKQTGPRHLPRPVKLPD